MDKYFRPANKAAPAYSQEALSQAIPHTSLLDRIHAEVQATAAEATRKATAESEFEADENGTTAAKDDNETPAPPQPYTPPNRHADGSFVTREVRENVMYVEDCETGVIPATTNELCLWDLQPFAGVPFPIPVGVDRKKRKINVLGYCCSVSCALSYAHSQPGLLPETYVTKTLGDFARDYFGASFSPELLLPAPPRAKLSMLHAKFAKAGASDPMMEAIRQFRNGTEALIFHFPRVPFVRVTHRIDEEVLQRKLESQHKRRLDLMTQTPKPIACTRRGMQEQRKYVLSKRAGSKRNNRGAIDALMGITYSRVDQDDSE